MRLTSSRRSRLRSAPLPVSVQLSAITALTAGAQGATALLSARWLGATDRGVLSIAQTLIIPLTLLGGSGLLTATRVLLADPRRGVSMSNYVRATRYLVALHAVVTAAVGVPLMIGFSRVTSLHVVVLFTLLAIANLRAALLREALHGVGHHRTAVLGELTASSVPLLSMASLYLAGSLTLETAFIAVSAGSTVQWVVQGVSVRRFERSHTPEDAGRASSPGCLSERSNAKLLGSMARFALPGLAASLCMAAAGRVDRLVLAAFTSPGDVGVYSTAATIADVPWLLPVAVSPIIVRVVARSGDATLGRPWWRRTVAATAVSAVLVVTVGSYVLQHFLGPDFAGSGALLMVLALASLPMASQQVHLAVCTGMGDLRAVLHSALASAGVGLAAYLALTPAFGSMGCAVGTVIAYSAGALFARRAVRRNMTLRTMSPQGSRKEDDGLGIGPW